jgi:hypothetical protein
MQARMSAERADTERRSAMQKMSIVQQLQVLSFASREQWDWEIEWEGDT